MMLQSNAMYCVNNLYFSPDAILKCLKAGLDQVDVVVTTGGVSMGEKVGYQTTFYYFVNKKS